MPFDRSKRIRELFADALDLPTAERTEFLAAACGTDIDLHVAVESLLTAHTKSASFAPELEPKPDEIVASAGTMIGRYRVLEPLGEGGFGMVYRAEQIEPIRRQVALKLIKAGMDTREVIARFDTERQALALMDHPGIARVLDAGATENGRPYFVMELVAGVPITEYCDQRTLTPEQRLLLFADVCHAVQHAHQKGIIHRDLKPTNILVEEVDDRAVPKIIDFGVAKALGRRLTGTTMFTRGEQLLGTPTYMSPEQAEPGGTDVDTRSDIYGLGVLLYELLTGTTPFDKEAFDKLALNEMRRIVRETEPPKPSTRLQRTGERIHQIAQRRHMEPTSLRKRLRGDLDWIVMKALEKDRRRRYDTASSFAQDIEHHLGHEPVMARPPSRVYRFQKLVRRNRLTFAAVGAVTAALALGAMVSAWQWRRAVAGEALARQQAYDADMNLAQRALAEFNLGRAHELLERHRPPTSILHQQPPTDLRGWEWRYLWQQARGNGSDILMSFTNPICAMALSSGGEWLAVREYRSIPAGSASDRITLWDLPRRRMVGQIRAKGWHRALAISTSLNLLVAAEFERSGPDQAVPVRLWDLSTLQEVGQLPHPEGINCFALSADEQQLATHADDEQLRLWDLPTRREIKRYPASRADITWLQGCLAFTPDGKQLVFGDSDGRTNRVIDLRTSRESSLSSPAEDGNSGGAVNAMALSPDGRWLAVNYGFGATPIELWDLGTGKCLHALAGHRASLLNVAFTPDGRTLASASADQTIRLWDVQKGRLIRILTGHTDEVVALAILPDGAGLVSASADGSVRLWNLQSPGTQPAPNTVTVRFQPFHNPFALFPCSQSVLCLDVDGTVVIRNLVTGELTERLTALGTNHQAVAVSPDGRWVAAGGPARQLSVWDLQQRSVVTNTTIQTGDIWALNFDSRGRILRVEATAGSLSSATVRLVDTRNWREVRSWNVERWNWGGLAWSPDDQLVAFGARDGTVTWWDAVGGRELEVTQGPSANATSLAFSPDSRWLAAASWSDGRVILWDTATRRVSRPPLRAHVQTALSVAFSPDGRRLVTGGMLAEEGIKIWNFETLSELLTLRAPRLFTANVALSPDGNFVVAQSPPYSTLGGSWLCLWHAPSWEEIAVTENVEDARSVTQPK